MCTIIYYDISWKLAINPLALWTFCKDSIAEQLWELVMSSLDVTSNLSGRKSLFSLWHLPAAGFVAMYRLLRSAAGLSALYGMRRGIAIAEEEDAEVRRMRTKREANIWPVHAMHGSEHRPRQKVQSGLVVLAGTSHPKLVEKVHVFRQSYHLHRSYAISKVCDELHTTPADAAVSRFQDGECSIEVKTHIRGKDVYVIQSCIAPVNDSVMELLLLVSTAKRAGAKRVTAVIPYFGYKHHRFAYFLLFLFFNQSHIC